MTCAVGFSSPSGVFLAADRRINWNNAAFEHPKDRKVYRPTPWLAWAFSGTVSYRDHLLGVEWPAQPARPNTQWAVHYIRKLLPRSGDWEFLLAIAGKQGRALLSATPDCFGRHEFYSIGSGREYADGAYFALRPYEPDPGILVRACVRAAAKNDSGVGGRIDVVRV